jgi:hypothetical protein
MVNSTGTIAHTAERNGSAESAGFYIQAAMSDIYVFSSYPRKPKISRHAVRPR